MKKDELYISSDGEFSGPRASHHELLSLGACLESDTSVNFYRELKPLTSNYTLKALQVAVKGLRSLDGVRHLPQYDPDNKMFDPDQVLQRLNEHGVHPNQAMHEFKRWLLNISGESSPIFVSFGSQDWKFVDQYLRQYTDSNPFGISVLDLKSYAMGKFGLSYHDVTKKKIKELLELKSKHTHNALDDAVEQAEIHRKMRY